MGFGARRIARLLLWGVSAALSLTCAAAPKPTAASLRIGANPPGFIEGRVRGLDGRPAAGIGVRGIPRGADIPWSPPATTACDGTFRLALAAPGDYGFLLILKGESVVTADPRDPALVEVTLEPGQTRSGVELTFLADEWGRITGKPVGTLSCPRAPAPAP
jgi:hypothetical protein